MHNQGILKLSFTFWVATCLLFMAAMSIGLTLFALSAFFVLWTDRAVWMSSFREAIGKNLFVWASLFLLGISLISIIFAWVLPPLGLAPQGFGEVKKFQYFLYPFLIAASLWYLEEKDAAPLSESPMTKAMLVVAALAAVASIFQYWAGLFLPVTWTENSSFFRPMTFVPNGHASHFHAQGFMQFHLSFASALFFPLSFCIAQLLWSQNKQKVIYAILAFTLALAIFYTYSRTAWLALAIVPGLACLLWRPRIFLIVTPIIFVVAGALWYGVPNVHDRLTDPMGMDGRKIVWRASWEMFKDRPLVGVGFGKTGQYSEAYAERFFGEKQWFSSHAHNNILDALASTGVFGLLAFLFWWALLYVYAARLFRGEDKEAKIWGGSFLLAATAFQINGLTQVNFYDAKSQHILILWVGIILFYQLKRVGQKKSGRAPAVLPLDNLAVLDFARGH